MSAEIFNKPIVLSLNRVWQVIGHRTVEQAIVAMNGGRDGVAPALALDISYAQLPDGSWDFDKPLFMTPVAWSDWIKLPVRYFDLSIHSAKLHIRVPTVIIAVNFAQMPVRTPRVSRHAIFERDGGVCQCTGEHVGRNGGNLDHVGPRDKGGQDTFENLVWAKKEINSLKANRLPHEVGLRLRRPPRAPKPLPVSATIRDVRHPDWRHFLTH